MLKRQYVHGDVSNWGINELTGCIRPVSSFSHLFDVLTFPKDLHSAALSKHTLCRSLVGTD